MNNELILDTILEDKNYNNVSFSSENDIRQFLDSFDIIQAEALDGNMDALCLIEDFSKLIYDNGQPVCEMICEYIKIKSGQKRVLDKNGDEIEDIIQQIATDKGRWVRTINKLIDEEIEFIIEKNTDKWLKSVKKKYDIKNRNSYDFEKVGQTIDKMSDDGFDRILRDIDYEKKYGRFEKEDVKNIKIEEYPQELVDLEKAYESNQERLKTLRKIEDRSDKEKKELNRRIKMSDDFLHDIKYVRDLYGINYEDNTIETFGDWNRFLYDDYMDSRMIVETLSESDRSVFSDNIKLNTVKRVAKEILTERQMTIFELYFFESMTQKEVAHIVGTSRWTISRNLDEIIGKIKKSLIFS